MVVADWVAQVAKASVGIYLFLSEYSNLNNSVVNLLTLNMLNFSKET